MRTIIDLPAEQLEALDSWCSREGISRAEAIRRCIAHHVPVVRPGQADPAYGLWKGRARDGVAYQRRVRREWD